MVFGARMAEAVLGGVTGPTVTGAMRTVLGDGSDEIPGRRVAPTGSLDLTTATVASGGADLAKSRDRMQLAMTTGAGVVRTAGSLEGAARALADVAETWRRSAERETVAGEEIRNLLTVGSALLVSAQERQESRGAHTRADFPETEPEWQCRLVHARPAGRG
jgi:succinate dehydrogenase/fumarate reductase flavoprotein subunit